MRFIDTTSWKFREVPDRELSRLQGGYSILSHRWTWGPDEIQYADILSMDEAVRAKGGFAKFAGACALARNLGHDLIWIDTCCINKTDAVELGEAINSMFRWYSMSSICIAYLEDVTPGSTVEESVWFARGWTFQELIAPTAVEFYDTNWGYLGNKSSLSNQILTRTGIPADVLEKSRPPQAYSVAQRMSWAAKRTTTRLEDRAYSLMGLFDVNMAMIYGEREQAFVRLQEHIIAKSADESIFVWDLGILEDSTRDAKQVHCGLLAPSPACFVRCNDMISTRRSHGFSVNQFGLTISSPATINTIGVYQAPLEVKNGQDARSCALLLAQLPEEGLFARVSSPSGDSFVMTEERAAQPTEFSVPLNPFGEPVLLYHGFWLRSLDADDNHTLDYTMFRRQATGQEDRLLLPIGRTGTAGIISLNLRSSRQANILGWIKLGFDDACLPMCCLISHRADTAVQMSTMATRARALQEFDPKPRYHPLSGPFMPERINHPFFSDDWIWESAYHNSRYLTSLTSSRGDGFAVDLPAPGFNVVVSAKRVPDVSPDGSPSRKQEVWAVDIIVTGRKLPPSSQRGDHDSNNCCGC